MAGQRDSRVSKRWRDGGTEGDERVNRRDLEMTGI